MSKFRLITRSDFDGLVCAALLKHLDMVDDILFVHPKEMQDGKIEVSERDISTNLPYVPGVHLAFDHHSSETLRVGGQHPNHIIHPNAPSAARVVYEHFGGAAVFPAAWNDMMAAVDKADSAQFSLDEVLNPAGWVLLSFITDSRTGLGRFRDFRISNYQLMMALIDACRTQSIDEIMALPDVMERVQRYFECVTHFKAQVERCACVRGNVVILDLRHEKVVWPGNRFIIYALFPQCNVSVHIFWGIARSNTVFAIGKSIVNRSARTDIGALTLAYGGGGHEAAGTCQFASDDSDAALDEIVARLNAEG